MAHFAELNDDNIVIRVVVGDDNMPNEGLDWIEQNLGGNWIKTSYNTQGGVHVLGGVPLRKNFGFPGYTYDPQLDAFIPPKPYASWILNTNTCLWEAPIAKPSDSDSYDWDEAAVNWVQIQE